MTAIILRVLSRAGRAINNPFAMNGGYVFPEISDARRDFSRITRDMRAIGKDLEKTSKVELKRNGK